MPIGTSSTITPTSDSKSIPDSSLAAEIGSTGPRNPSLTAWYIIEYLEETFPEPALLPSSVAERARVRSMALSIACEIQPLNNSAVLGFLTSQLGVSEKGKLDWICKWIARGFGALESLLTRSAETGVYCHGDTPSVADVCLVPQVYNAVRFDVDLGSYPTLMGIHDRCQQLEAFIKAAPENQPDAQPA